MTPPPVSDPSPTSQPPYVSSEQLAPGQRPLTSSISIPQSSQKVQRSGHPIFIGFIFLILLLVGGTTAYAWQAGVFLSPDNALLRALASVYKVPTEHINFNIFFDGTYGTSNVNGQLTVEGDMDRTDANHPKFATNLHAAASGVSADLGVKLVNDIAYFNLRQAPFIGMMGDGKILNNWYSISQADIDAYAAKNANGNTALTKAYSINAFKQKLTNGDGLNYFNEMKSANVISSPISLGISMASGTLVRTYSIDVDKDNLVTYMIQKAEQADASTSLSSPALPALDAKMKAQYEADVRKAFQNLTFSPITFVVGLLDGNLRHVDVSVSYTNTSKNTSADSYSDSYSASLYNSIAHISISNDYSNIGVPVDIQAPANSTPLLAYLEASTARTKAATVTNVAKDAVSNLGVEAQAYVSKSATHSYEGFCTKDDQVRGYFSTLSAYDKGSIPFCRTNASQYIVGTTLSNGTVYCTDATHLDATLTATPKGMICR